MERIYLFRHCHYYCVLIKLSTTGKNIGVSVDQITENCAEVCLTCVKMLVPLVDLLMCFSLFLVTFHYNSR